MQTLDLVRGETLAGTPSTAEESPLVITEAWAGHTSGYLARLEPCHREGSPLYDLERLFVDPWKNQQSAWGNGRRLYRLMEAGVYEAESRWHSGKVRRHWFELLAEGQLRMLASRNEAMARLWVVGLEDLQKLRLEAWQERPSRVGWQSRQVAAAEANQQGGLPELEGTARQVGYAEVLRSDWLTQIGRRLRAPESVPWRFLRQLRALEAVADAAWWIDHRRGPWRRLLAEARRL